jgi:CBS domain-containing protein
MQTEALVFIDDDGSEPGRMQASGVLPLRLRVDLPELRLNDPALHAMTDFRRTVPISTPPERPADDALADMRRLGVRALLVISCGRVVGLVTSYDIDRARVSGFPQPSDTPRREHSRVADIMTEWDNLPTIDWATMQSARIGDLIEILHGVGVMHLLVVEGDAGAAGTVVRGLISLARIEARLERAEGRRNFG